jgi:hypothetical protein
VRQELIKEISEDLRVTFDYVHEKTLSHIEIIVDKNIVEVSSRKDNKTFRFAKRHRPICLLD